MCEHNTQRRIGVDGVFWCSVCGSLCIGGKWLIPAIYAQRLSVIPGARCTSSIAYTIPVEGGDTDAPDYESPRDEEN